jgi:hypothetical protein
VESSFQQAIVHKMHNSRSFNSLKEEETSVCFCPQGAPGVAGAPGPKGIKGDSRTITTKG